MMVKLLIISILAGVPLIMIYGISFRRKKNLIKEGETKEGSVVEGGMGKENLIGDQVNLPSLTSFPEIRKEIIKEKIHPVKQAEEWFEEGVKNQNLKNYDEARDYYSKALEVFTKREYPYVFATIQNNIGTNL